MRRWTTMMVLAVLLSACGHESEQYNRGNGASTEPQDVINHPVANQPLDKPEQQSAGEQLTRNNLVHPIPVTFKTLVMETTTLTPVKANEVERVLQNVALDDSTVSLYNKKDNDWGIYASITTAESEYEINDIIGYGNDSTNITISQIDFNGIPLVKIEGFIGASAPLTQYVQIVDDRPVSFWETESHVFEYDVDLDGTQEMIVAAGGTIPDTSLVKYDSGHYSIANLNELTNGSVSFDFQNQILQVYYGLDKKPEQYRLTSHGLEFAGYIET